MTIFSKTLFLSAMIFCASPVVQAATVKQVTGTAHIDRGAGFTALTEGTKLRPNENLMVGENGKAIVEFEDGCSITVTPGAVFTVRGKRGDEPKDDKFQSECTGAVGGTAGVSPVAIGLGVAVIGGGAALAASSKGKSSSPASP